MVKKKTSNLEQIKTFLEIKQKWVERAADKEEKTGVPTQIPLSKFLNKELESSVADEVEAYAEALGARTFDEKHQAILNIIEARRSRSVRRV